MPTWSDIFQLTATIVMAIGVVILWTMRHGAQGLAKEAGKRAANEVFDKLEWPAKLAREIEKSRAMERQELRFKSYGALWTELRPLAVYEEGDITNEVAESLYKNLSDWYFSACGGLLLTTQARDFYFAFQDLLRDTAAMDSWTAKRGSASGAELGAEFEKILKQLQCADALATKEFLRAEPTDDWDELAPDQARKWKADVGRISKNWAKLSEAERFACLQQVSSVLRSSLTIDLDSRLR